MQTFIPATTDKTAQVRSAQPSHYVGGTLPLRLNDGRPETARLNSLQTIMATSHQALQARMVTESQNGSTFKLTDNRLLQRVEKLDKPAQLGQPIVQRVIDEDEAYCIATHIVDKFPAVQINSLTATSGEIRSALMMFDLSQIYEKTPGELDAIKNKITSRRAEINKAKAKEVAIAKEEKRKTDVKNFYAMNAERARIHLETLTAAELGDLKLSPEVFRTYQTTWGWGSEYMFRAFQGKIANFVIHVHWNNGTFARSGVRLKSHLDKTKSTPGLTPLTDDMSNAFRIPLVRGEAEQLAEKNG